MSNYNTGTVAVTSGSATLTGTGTSWASAGIRKGAPISIKLAEGENIYYVNSVDSDTQITLTANVAEASQSALSYTIAIDFDLLGAPIVSTADKAWPRLLQEANEIRAREIERRQFRASVAYEFDDSADGWSGTNATLETYSDDSAIPKSAVRYTVTAGSHYMSLGSLSINADVYDRVAIRCRYISGTEDGVWTLSFDAGSGWQSHPHYRDVLIDDGEWRWVLIDLSNDSNWTGTVTDLRIAPPTNADNDLVVEIDVVAVGKSGVSTLLATSGTGVTYYRETPTNPSGDTFAVARAYSQIVLVQNKDGLTFPNLTYSDAGAGEFTATYADGVTAVPGSMASDLLVTYVGA